MRTRLLTMTIATIAACGAIAPLSCPAQEGPSAAARRDAQLGRDVERLVQELSSPTRAARGAAEKSLIELGPGVLAHLPPPELLPSVSVREAIRRVRIELEQRHSRERIRAARVTLTGEHTLGEWLAQLASESGNAIQTDGLPTQILGQRVPLELGVHDFWPAFEQLARRGSFDIAESATARGLALMARDDRDPRPRDVFTSSGPFQIRARPAEVVALGRPRPAFNFRPRRRILKLALEVRTEPRLRPLFAHFAAAEIVARPAMGEALRPLSPDARYELAVGEPGAPVRMQVEYLLPPQPAPESLNVTGKFGMTIAADQAQIRFASVTSHQNERDISIARRRGGVTVTLRRVTRERTPEGTSELRVLAGVTYDEGGPAFESHRTWIIHNEVWLEAGDKRLPLNGGYETTRQEDGGVGMEYRFVDLPDPLPELAFVYVAPTLIVDVPAEFEIESVPVGDDG